MTKALDMKRAADMTAQEWSKRRFWRWRSAWVSVFDAMNADQLTALFTRTTQGDAVSLFVDKNVMRDVLQQDIPDGSFDEAWLALRESERRDLLQRCNMPGYSMHEMVTRTITAFAACRSRDEQYAAEMAH